MRKHTLDSPVSYYAIFLAVRYLPYRISCLLGKIVVLLVYAFSRKDRENLADNLSIALGKPHNDCSIRRTVRQTYVNYGQYMVDFFLIPQLPAHKVRTFVSEIRGETILERSLANGKGVILLSAHIGNWEIGGTILRLLNYPLSVVAMPHNTKATNALVNHLRQDRGIKVIEMTLHSPFSGLEIMGILRENGIVAMIGDKDFFGTGRTTVFFNRRISFPVGPVVMAMKSGAALIPSFVIRKSDGKYLGILEEPVPLDTGSNWKNHIDGNIEKTARIFEKYIRRYPSQWYCPDPIAGKETAG